jgi:hypothetical protein
MNSGSVHLQEVITSATHHLLSPQETQMLMVTATLNTQSHQGTMHYALKI